MKKATEAGTPGRDDGEGVDLDPRTVAVITSVHDQLEKMDLFTLFDLDLNASADLLRRAYFKRSRLFHPDRYFRRRLGPYKKMLERIFAWMAASYDFLKDDRRRAAYRKRILSDRDGGAVSFGPGACLVAVPTAGGLELRIADEAAFFRAIDEAPVAAAGDQPQKVRLPQRQYSLPRLRPATAAPLPRASAVQAAGQSASVGDPGDPDVPVDLDDLDDPVDLGDLGLPVDSVDASVPVDLDDLDDSVEQELLELLPVDEISEQDPPEQEFCEPRARPRPPPRR